MPLVCNNKSMKFNWISSPHSHDRVPWQLLSICVPYPAVFQTYKSSISSESLQITLQNIRISFQPINTLVRWRPCNTKAGCGRHIFRKIISIYHIKYNMKIIVLFECQPLKKTHWYYNINVESETLKKASKTAVFLQISRKKVIATCWLLKCINKGLSSFCVKPNTPERTAYYFLHKV